MQRLQYTWVIYFRLEIIYSDKIMYQMKDEQFQYLFNSIIFKDIDHVQHKINKTNIE